MSCDVPHDKPLERMTMSQAPLIPPHEAPPSAWRGDSDSLSWRRALLGAIIGGAIGLAAFLLDASPWWWLAVIVGFGLGPPSRQIDLPVLWWRK